MIFHDAWIATVIINGILLSFTLGRGWELTPEDPDMIHDRDHALGMMSGISITAFLQLLIAFILFSAAVD